MATPPQFATPPTPHSLSTHIVKAHLAFFDNGKDQFCSVKDYPNLSSIEAVVVSKSLSAAGVKNEPELKAAKASGYIVTLTPGKDVNVLADGKDAIGVSSTPYTDWSLTATASFNLPTDEAFWDGARDAIKGFHRALKGLFVPAMYTRATQYKRGKQLESSKTIHYDNKVWYPLSDVLALYETLLAKSKVGEEWTLFPVGVLAVESKLAAYVAIDQTPLDSVTCATTLENKYISDVTSMKHHLGLATPKRTTGSSAGSAEQVPKVSSNATGIKSITPTWSNFLTPFGTATNVDVYGAIACTTYLDQIFVMWQSRENGNPLYFGVYAGDPNNGGDGLILGPTPVVDGASASPIITTLTPTLIALDDTLHLIVGSAIDSSSQKLVHYCFNRALTAPRWILADSGSVGPTSKGTPPALGVVDDSTLMCMWVDSSNTVLDWAVWQQNPNWNPSDPNNANQAPLGQRTKGKSSVAINGQTVKTSSSPALIMLSGKLAVSYADSNNHVQLLGFSDLTSQTWTTFAPGLNPDPSAQGLIGGGYDDKYAIIAARSPNQQGIAVSIWRGGTWDAHSGLNEASQDSVCAVILNRCAYIFFESTEGGHQYRLFCVYLDLTAIPYHPSSWMKDLKTDRRLNVMAIPATHDTGTYNAPWTYKAFGIATQGMDLKTQLYAGIRAFDFRLDFDTSGNVIFVHGGWDVDLDFNDACDVLYSFLANQRNDVLIVSIKNDGNNPDSAVFSAVDKELAAENYSYWYGANTSTSTKAVNDLPLLSQARGSIVLLRRLPFYLPPYGFGVDFSAYSSGQPVAKFTVSGALQGGDLNVVVQDVYQIGLGHGSTLRVHQSDTPIPDYDTKWNYIQSVLSTSANETSGTSSTLYVNFTSAACAVAGEGFPPPIGWDPAQLAEGMSTYLGLVDYEGINSKTQRYFDQTPQTTAHGLIYMDFPEDPDETITSIVEANTFN